MHIVVEVKYHTSVAYWDLEPIFVWKQLVENMCVHGKLTEVSEYEYG